MRRTRIARIWAVIGGITALWALYFWLFRSPVGLSVVRVEPNSMVYFGERKAIQVTFRVRSSDSAFQCHIVSFHARVAGRWMEFQGADGFPFAGFPGPVGGGMRLGTVPEETLVMPEGTEACRVQIRYLAVSLKRQFILSLGQTGQRWVAKSPWRYELGWPGKGPVPWEPPKTNTVEITIPQSDRKSGALLPSAHNEQVAALGPRSGQTSVGY